MDGRFRKNQYKRPKLINRYISFAVDLFVPDVGDSDSSNFVAIAGGDKLPSAAFEDFLNGIEIVVAKDGASTMLSTVGEIWRFSYDKVLTMMGPILGVLLANRGKLHHLIQKHGKLTLTQYKLLRHFYCPFILK
uniref:Uncharacterized protein n=1 Tax=Romanomermis culicivorax TaxID=13658 RepID=A0A915KXN4_ROMCU